MQFKAARQLGGTRSSEGRNGWCCQCALLALVLAFGVGTASASDYQISQWVIASGGVIETESDDQQWKLSGTIGQWEATEARALSGGPWRLTGGFWGLSPEELANLLFRDRFEAEADQQSAN